MKTKRTIACVCLAALLLVLLTSCGGNLSGTYKMDDGGLGLNLGEITFNGNKATITMVGTEIGECEYKVSGKKITFIAPESEGDDMEADYDKSSETITLEGAKFVKEK